MKSSIEAESCDDSAPRCRSWHDGDCRSRRPRQWLRAARRSAPPAIAPPVPLGAAFVGDVRMGAQSVRPARLDLSVHAVFLELRGACGPLRSEHAAWRLWAGSRVSFGPTAESSSRSWRRFWARLPIAADASEPFGRALCGDPRSGELVMWFSTANSTQTACSLSAR